MSEKVSINPADIMSAQDLAAQYRGRATNSRNTDTRSGLTSADNASLVRTTVGAFSGRVVGAGSVQDMAGMEGKASIVNDGMVTLPNGMTVSREVALNAGFVRETADGLVLADLDFADDKTKEQITRQKSTQQTEMDEAAKETKALNDAFARADAALDLADKTLPGEVKSTLTNAAIAGDVEVVEQMLGEKSFNAMVEGYTAFVDHLAKGETGVPGMSELMQYVLDDSELQMARRAALFRDTQSLKYLSATAFKAMNDPERNGPLIEAITEAGGKVTQKSNGTFAVTINGQEVGLQDAFKRKLIRFD
ncbi:MAG: hypothetical protein AB7U75_19900 [Hyphomicrobiaceae bacterium]